MKKLLYFFIGLMLFLIPATAETNNCERLARTYQTEHGGSLVFVQPLKDNGAYDLGRYNGHWLNYVHSEYIDAGSGMILNSPSTWFDRKSEWWTLSEKRPPFPMIFAY